METLEIKKEQTLPDTLWELAQVALDDLIKTEEFSDKYQIDMNVWYQTNGKCSVCLAGAVAAQTLGAGNRGEMSLFNMFPNLQDKFSAIDDLRVGNIKDAYWELHGIYPDEEIPFTLEMPDYDHDPKFFKEKFKEMIDILKKHQV